MSDQGTQSVRQAARKAAFAAQTRRRTLAAERDKRVDAGVIALVIALRERSDAEKRAATALRGLLGEGLTLRDVVECAEGDLAPKEARRLANLTPITNTTAVDDAVPGASAPASGSGR